MAADRSAGTTAALHVDVVYLGIEQQFQRTVQLAAGATVRDAIDASGVLAEVAELRNRPLDTGVFNRVVPLDATLDDGDRVEIYRPLTVDPKAARRVRAEVRRRRKQRTGGG